MFEPVHKPRCVTIQIDTKNWSSGILLDSNFDDIPYRNK